MTWRRAAISHAKNLQRSLANYCLLAGASQNLEGRLIQRFLQSISNNEGLQGIDERLTDGQSQERNQDHEELETQNEYEEGIRGGIQDTSQECQDPELVSFYTFHIQNVRKAIAAHRKVGRRKKDANLYLDRIRKAIDQNRTKYLRDIFKEMQEEHIKPTNEIYLKALLGSCHLSSANIDDALFFFNEMRKHGHRIPDTVYAAILTAGTVCKRFDINDELIYDLEAWGLADTHKIRQAKLATYSAQGRVEDCMQVLDECIAKKDPVLTDLYSEAMQAVANQVLNSERRDRDLALKHVLSILEDAKDTIDFERHPYDKDVLLEKAMKVFDQVGLHNKILELSELISRPSSITRQLQFLAHIKLGVVYPGISDTDRRNHMQSAKNFLDKFRAERMPMRKETIHAVLMTCLKPRSKNLDSDLHTDEILDCCERFLDYMIALGRIMLKEKSTTRMFNMAIKHTSETGLRVQNKLKIVVPFDTEFQTVRRA